MQKFFMTANLVMFAILSLLIWNNLSRVETDQTAVNESEQESFLTSKSVKLITNLERSRFSVVFDSDMVEAIELGHVVGSNPISLHPFVQLRSEWISKNTLRCYLPVDLPRSGAYTAWLSPDLESLSGKRMKFGTKLSFKMPGIKIQKMQAVIGKDDRREIHLSPSHRIKSDSLAPLVSVKDEEGRDCKFVVIRVEDSYDYRIILEKEFKPLRVDVKIAAGLKPVKGFPTSEDFARRLRFFDEVGLNSPYVQGDHVKIYANNYLDGEIDKSYVSITPDVPFRIENHGHAITLHGDFVPGSPLTMQFKKGFPGNGDSRLSNEQLFDIDIPDVSPRLSFAQNGSVLSALAKPRLKLKGCNVAKFKLAIRSVYPNNFVEFAKANPANRAQAVVYGPWHETLITSGGLHNKEFEKTVSIRTLIAEAPSGLHEVLLMDDKGRAASVSKLIQITDLGITVRASEKAMAVYVSGLALAQDIIGADVQVYSKTNQLLAETKTNNQGLAHLNFDNFEPGHGAFLIRVVKGKDQAYVDLKGHAIEMSEGVLGGDAFLKKGYEAYVWTDQGVLRPGKTIHVTALLRGLKGEAPSGRVVELRWQDPNGNKSDVEELRTSGSGFLHVQKHFPAESRTGAWSVVLRDKASNKFLGEARFKVEAFMPQRIEAGISIKDTIIHGKTARVEVRANWLEGSPADGLTVKLYPRYDNTLHQFEKFKEFSFGLPPGDSSEGAVKAIKGILGKDGKVILKMPVPLLEKYAAAQEARLTVEVMDPSGRSVRSTITRPVFQDTGHLGIRYKYKKAEVILLNPDSTVMKFNGKVSFSLEKRNWRWRWVKTGQRYRWKHYVEAHEVWSAESEMLNGRAIQEVKDFTLKNGGWLVIVARTEEQIAEVALSGVPDKPDRLSITAPKKIFVGKKFQFTVESPISGRAFITLEGHTLLSSKLVELEKGSTMVTLDMVKAYSHANVHVVATLLRSQARSRGVAWAKGATSIEVAHPDRDIQVSLLTPKSVRPGESIPVSVLAPGAKEVVIALVDEGILQITKHASPQPSKYFNRRRRLTGFGADIRSSLMEGYEFPHELVAGGGGGDYGKEMEVATVRLGSSTSGKILALALDSKILKLDSEGRAEHEFILPDYEGRVRVMVIAASPKATGSASADVSVTGPVSLKVAVPRMAAPGDEARLSVSLRNNDVISRDLELTLSSGGGLKLLGMTQSTFHLDAGESRHLEVPVRVLESNVAVLKARAGWPGEMRHVKKEFVVRNPGIYEELSLGLVLSDEGKIKLPGVWQGGRAKGELRLSYRPDSRLLAPLETLVRYPYGCVEQTSSKGYALLACADLLDSMEGKKSKEAKKFVQVAIRRLFQMQTYQGGLSWWVGGNDEYAYGSIYAGEFLRLCKDRGYKLPKHDYKQLTKRVSEWFRGGPLSQRCQAAMFLAGTGRPIKIWLERLGELAESEEDRTRLAIAWSRIGQHNRAIELLKPLPVKKGEKKKKTQNNNLSSSLKLVALRLRALLLAQPRSEEILSLVSRLESQVKAPVYMNTHELGQGILALSVYYSSMKESTDAFVGRINGGKGFKEVNGEAVIEVDLKNGGEITYKGKGLVYGRLLLKGFRTDAQPKASKHIAIDQVIYDVDTGEKVTHFKRGGLYEVVMDINFKRSAENFVVTEVLPGGFEVENPRLFPYENRDDVQTPDHLEVRDDRVIFFVNGRQKGHVKYSYRMRAVFPGVYKKLPASFEAMYDPENRARLGFTQQVSIAP
jgi:uncharacterized protein YfaS (alpha-2-macroglobulin family)